jgi:hypothetical protein
LGGGRQVPVDGARLGATAGHRVDVQRNLPFEATEPRGQADIGPVDAGQGVVHEGHLVELVVSAQGPLLLKGEPDMVVLAVSDHCALPSVGWA